MGTKIAEFRIRNTNFLFGFAGGGGHNREKNRLGDSARRNRARKLREACAQAAYPMLELVSLQKTLFRLVDFRHNFEFLCVCDDRPQCLHVVALPLPRLPSGAMMPLSCLFRLARSWRQTSNPN